MNKIITLNKLPRSLACILLTLWSLLLLVNFLPIIPQPAIIIGYLWKVEFAFATFLFISIIFFLKLPKEKFIKFTRKEFFWIILPLILFTIWSAFSCFWAESWRSALHHTLLWACYIVFYILIRQIVAQPRLLNLSLTVTGIVVAILGIVCLIEYFSTSAEYSVNVSLRYSKYAEAIATLFILFVALAISKKNRHSMLLGTIGIVSWLGITFSLGRTQLIAALSGIFVFIVLALIRFGRGVSPKKAIIFSAIFILVTVFSQIPSISGGSQQTTLKRFSGDEQSRASFQVRFLFWEIALENFKEHPILGVGADNFAINYPNARKNYTKTHLENQNLNFYEDVLPERPHNEFLQIMAELGIVGCLIFGWLLLGILRFTFSMRKSGGSLLTIASVAGIAAFLVSSLASSYSFRVPANGLCFFFVLALAVKEWRVESRESRAKMELFSSRLSTPDSRLVFGLLICSAMLIFSAVRGAGLMYLQIAVSSSEEAESEQNFQKAIALDNQDGLFRYYYGLHLYNHDRAEEAIPQLEFAIDKGIATSITYFNLISAQIVSRKTEEAEQTFNKSLLVYPRSVFLRTIYAAFLKENGRALESQIEYEKAFQINAEQTRSWWLAYNEGLKKLTQTEFRDKQFVQAMELRPTDGIYALLDFQRQFKPNLVRR